MGTPIAISLSQRFLTCPWDLQGKGQPRSLSEKPGADVIGQGEALVTQGFAKHFSLFPLSNSVFHS